MTYGALLTGSYLNNHSDERYGEEIFSDFYYNDVYYDQLKRQIYENGYERSHGLGLSVNARYDNRNINILHTVSVGWNISSESGTFSKDVWDFDLFSAAQSTSSYRFHNISPQVRAIISSNSARSGISLQVGTIHIQEMQMILIRSMV